MAKNDYRSNMSSSKNISILRKRFRDKRILVLAENIKEVKGIENLNAYFDIIIVEGFEALKSYKRPDIFLDVEDSPYHNSSLRENRYKGLDNTLICANFTNLQKMKKLNLKFKNFILSFMPHDVVDAAAGFPTFPYVADGVRFGLNKNSIGVHLAITAGARSVFSTYTSTMSTKIDKDSLVAFVEESEPMTYGTKRKNVIRINRGLFLEENGI